MLEEEVRVDRAVMKEEEESGELRRESSSMYLSISSKNSSIPTVAQKSVPMFACFSLKSITPNCI